MTGTKDTIRALAIYASVAGVLVGAIGAGAVAIATHAPDKQQAAQERSPLQARLDSAREIKEALARPIPAPEPLGPISSKLKPQPQPLQAKVAEAKLQQPKPKPRRVVPQVREVFASFEPQPEPFFQLFAFGPGRR